MKKQVKLLIAAIVLLAVVLAGFFWLRYIQQKEMEDVYSEVVGIALNEVDKADIVAIAYQSEANQLAFQLQDGVWRAESDPDFPLVQEKISRMVYYLAGLTADKKLADQASDLAGFGLDPAQITIKAQLQDGSVLTYYLGNALPDATGYYLMAEGDPALYRVGALFHDAFSYSMPQLAAQQELPQGVDVANISYFAIQRPQDKLEFSQTPEGSEEIYTTQYRWLVSQAGGPEQAAATKAVTTVLKAITKLQYLEVVNYEAQQGDLAQYGLDKPIQIDMDYLPQTEDDTQLPLASMHLLLGATDADGNVYAQLAGSNLVGVVDGSILGALSYSGVQDFLPMDVCKIGIETIVGLDIRVDDMVFAIVANRSSDNQAVVTYSLNDRVLGDEAFTAFYELLTSMVADDTTSTGSQVTTPAEVSIQFHRNTTTFHEMQLDFIPYDANFYLVDFDGRRELLANKRDVQAFVKALEAL